MKPHLSDTSDPSPRPRPRTRRVVAVGAAVQGTSILPLFLTGALAVQLQAEFGFGPAALGIATGMFTLSRAMTSVRLGRLADQLGATRSMRLSAAGCALALAATALLVHNWGMLVAALGFAGVVQAISQPAVNRFVARSVPANRLGLAFGIKQSGPPTSAILAGVAVPAIALTVGWRWAFGGAAILAAVAYVAIPPRPQPAPAIPERPRERGGEGLGMIMLGMVFSLAAINSMQTFVVDSGVAAGLSPGSAGVLLSAGGVVAVMVRVGSGIRADRRGGGHFYYVARLLALGTVGYTLLAMGRPELHVIGALLAYGSIWGMNGVLFLAIVRHKPRAPAAASGSTIAVGSVGGFCGPPVFGFVVQTFGYPAAWLMTAAWAAIAAGAIAASRAAREDAVPRVS